MNKVIAIVIVLVVLAGGGYALVKHNDSKNKTNSTTSSSAYGASSSSNTGSSSSNQAASGNNAVLTTKSSSSVGSYLADSSGNALYTYGSDSSGVSNCNGSCLAAWPAYAETGATTGLPANVSTLKRSDDGKIQFTYKGMPLYTFTSDSSGQVTGDGVSNFHVAKP